MRREWGDEKHRRLASLYDRAKLPRIAAALAGDYDGAAFRTEMPAITQIPCEIDRTMAKFGRFAIILMVAGLSACTFPKEYEPAVDMTGHTRAQYDYDLTLCRENAKELDILPAVAIGVVAGAGLGGAFGALAGDAGAGAAIGVPAGAIAAGAAGSLYQPGKIALEGQDPHAADVRDCLKGRGYTLLDLEPAEAERAGGEPQP